MPTPPRKIEDDELESALADGYASTPQGDETHPHPPADPRAAPEGDGGLEDQLSALELLNALGDKLSAERKRCVEWREQSGIEDVWLEDNDAYEGIDDLNRWEEHVANRRRVKPHDAYSVAPAETPGKSAPQRRSNAYLNLTAPYCDGAAARVCDMLLPSDDKPWALDPTPVPEFVDAVSNQGGEGEESVNFNGVPIAKKDLAESAMNLAKKAAAAAETQIDDWLTECNFGGEVRSAISDATRLGTGVLKGPYPVSIRKNAWLRDEQGSGVRLEIKQDIKPRSKRVNPWNIYPAAGCGENPQNGDHLWERDDLSRRQLRDLKKQADVGYIDVQIDACLREGPTMRDVENPTAPDNVHDDTTYEIWYRYGFLTADELQSCGCNTSEMGVEGEDVLPAVVEVVNKRVIKATIAPLDDGSFPFDFFTWKRREAMPWGMGVARQIRTPQRMINAAVRNMLDNAGLSSGPQIILLEDVVHPADGDWTITPRKLWYADKEANLQDLKAAFMAVQIECNSNELMVIIELAMKMAEQLTGMPAIVQGQQGDAPDLVGVVNILNANANAVLRRIARHADDSLFEPHIERYHVYLMQHGTDPTTKGLFVVKARGSSVLVERDIQNQAILQLAPMALQPAYRIDPNKYSTEALKARKLDPERLKYDDAEWQKLMEQAAQKPQDPRVAIAQMQQALDKARMEQDASLEQMRMKLEETESERDRNHEIMLEGIRGEINQAEAQGRNVIDLGKIKAQLAGTVMTERNKMTLQNREIDVKKEKGSGI